MVMIAGTNSTLNLDPFNGVYGLPPSTWVSDEMLINSMPVFEIIPGKPHFDSGLNLFRIDDATTEYKKILSNHGYATPLPIKCAFLADNFPTDTFTNEYGETFLQKFTDVASKGMSQMIQMTGSENLSGAIDKMGNFTTNVGEGFGEDSVIGGILKAGGKGAQSVAQSFQNLQKNASAKGGVGGMLGGGAGLIDKMMGGHRVDFPQVWTNSGFTPSYTATVRLYNPNPGSAESTNKYIIGPLAVLLCLAVPRSDDGKTYNWPFFHKIKATGIYNLDPAVITNLTIVKGGDQQQISYNQKLSMVDVRIDFTSLYGSMLVEEGQKTFTNRPTVRSYLDSLKAEDKTLSSTRDEVRKLTGAKAGVSDINATQTTQVSEIERLRLLKYNAAKQRQAPIVSEVLSGNRVNRTIVNKQEELEDESDPGFITDTIG